GVIAGRFGPVSSGNASQIPIFRFRHDGCRSELGSFVVLAGGNKHMRFMVMHKVDAAMEAGERPAQRIIVEMGKLVQRSIKEGIFKDGAGLHRSATRARISFAGGKSAVTRGPYAGDNELLAHFALIATTGIEQAIELAIELGEASGRREV